MPAVREERAAEHAGEPPLQDPQDVRRRLQGEDGRDHGLQGALPQMQRLQREHQEHNNYIIKSYLFYR